MRVGDGCKVDNLEAEEEDLQVGLVTSRTRNDNQCLQLQSVSWLLKLHCE